MISDSDNSGGVFVSAYLKVITGMSLGTEKGHMIKAAIDGICADLYHIIGNT